MNCPVLEAVASGKFTIMRPLCCASNAVGLLRDVGPRIASVKTVTTETVCPIPVVVTVSVNATLATPVKVITGPAIVEVTTAL